MEDSHSGLVHYLGKVATVKTVQGFKSLIFRQKTKSENVTIKYYDKRDGRRILLPKSTNSMHQPIIPEGGDSVQGIVQEVIKKEGGE